MRVMSATEVKRRFRAALEAAQGGPVMIRKRGREVAVLLSTEEYKKLRGVRIAAFEKLCAGVSAKAASRGLTDESFNTLIRDTS